MAQWLSTLIALPEELGSIPSTHVAAHNHQLQGANSSLSGLHDTRHLKGVKQLYM